MSGEQPTGQDAPVVIDEATTLQPEQTATTGTTTTQTDGGEGGDKGSPDSETVTLTKAELQDRMDRATAKAAAKAERRAFREATDRLTAQQQQRPAQQAASDDGKPTRAQFASEDDWLDARDTWRDRKREVESKQTREQEGARTLATKTEKLYAEAAKLPGFDAEAFDEVIRESGLSGMAVRALIDSDMAAQLMAHFATNAEDVERIAKLSPERQTAELGKLEAKLTQPKPPAKSNAPRALALVKGAGASGDMPDPADTKAYIRWANQQERAARR